MEIELASLSKEAYNDSLKLIEEQLLNQKIAFLRNLHSFKNLSRKQTIKFVYLIEKEKVKSLYGQTVYSEGEPSEYIYIILKGSFELSRKIKCENRKLIDEHDQDTDIKLIKAQKKPKNILSIRMPEIKDFPYTHRLSILEPGSLAGEEDVLTRDNYQCSLKCFSSKGTLWKMRKEYFKMLKMFQKQWNEVLLKVAYKECRVDALDIKQTTKAELSKEHAKIEKQRKPCALCFSA